MQNDRATVNKKLKCKKQRCKEGYKHFCILGCHFNFSPLVFEFLRYLGFILWWLYFVKENAKLNSPSPPLIEEIQTSENLPLALKSRA
jgi:hypothetical protein